MDRVVVFGRGGAGKTVFSVRLGEVLGVPVRELDALFWASGLEPLPRRAWTELQRRLVREDRWILDGDLGPYDAPAVRLRAADTVIVLDFGVWRCAWRAVRRSRENRAFWTWTLTYRRRSLPRVLAAVAEHAGGARLVVLRSPGEAERFLTATRAAPPRNSGDRRPSG